MADLQIPETERYREAIDSVRKRVPVSRDVWDDMQAEERAHAFTVSQVARIDVLQDVLDSMDKAVEKGTALDDFRAEVADKLIEQWGGAEIPGRIEVIFRTNIQTAYAEGRHAINSAPAVKEARPFWRYDDTDNDRECDLCHECGGTVLPADDPWWRTHTPPLHHQCECTVTALAPDEAAEEGLTSPDDKPDVEADEGFGNEPSSVGRDWAPDLTDLDPELRKALEAKLAEFEEKQPRERQEPQPRPEPEQRKPEREPEREPREAPEPEETAPVQEKIRALLEEHETKNVDTKHEEARIVSGDGRVLLDKKGTKNYVEFSPSEMASLRNQEASLSHNHPSGSSLSPADLYMTLDVNGRQMRAVGRSQIDQQVYVYSFNRPDGGWPTTTRMKAIVEAADLQEQWATMANFAAKKISILEADRGHWHRVWERVQAQVDIGYRRDKIKG